MGASVSRSLYLIHLMMPGAIHFEISFRQKPMAVDGRDFDYLLPGHCCFSAALCLARYELLHTHAITCLAALYRSVKQHVNRFRYRRRHDAADYWPLAPLYRLPAAEPQKRRHIDAPGAGTHFAVTGRHDGHTLSLAAAQQFRAAAASWCTSFSAMYDTKHSTRRQKGAPARAWTNAFSVRHLEIGAILGDYSGRR